MKKEICALIVVLMLCFSGQAFAKEIIFNNVDAKISLNADGSAVVTETWTLNFMNSRFRSFAKPIDCEMSELKNVEVLLDGVQCAETEDGDEKPVWTYETLKTDGLTEVVCYFDLSGEEHILELKYIVKNLVSVSDNAQLQYVLVNEGFTGEIRNANIEIEFPYSVDAEDITVNDLTLTGVSDNLVRLNGSRTNGVPLSVSVNAPKYIFSAKKTGLGFGIGALMVLFAVLFIAFAFVFRRKIIYLICKSGSAYKGMKDADIAQEIYGFNGASEFIRINKKRLNSKKMPVSAFLWLMAKGILYCDAFGTIRIKNVNASGLNSYDLELAENVSGVDANVCFRWICCILRGEKSSFKNDRNVSKMKNAFSLYKKHIIRDGISLDRDKYVVSEACRMTESVPYYTGERLSEYGALALSEPGFEQDLTKYILAFQK